MTWKVAVATPTFKRPGTLRRCLGGTAAMHQPSGEPVELVVVVVDNDPEGSAREVATGAATELGLDLTYVVESNRGLVAVRNRLVAEVRALGATHLMFVDDDEIPRPDLMARMVDLMRTTGAAVVQGPSEPEFDVPPAPWMVKGRFFERERFGTGEVIPYNYGRTSGVLVDMAAVEQLDEPIFHPVYALSSGEDVDFFLRIQRNGGSIVWCDEAVIDELVPVSRISARWLIKRSFRYGTTRSAVFILRDQPSLLRRVKRAGAGLRRIAGGTVSFLWSWRQGKAGLVRSAQDVARGAGVMIGVSGYRYQEYKKTHGG